MFRGGAFHVLVYTQFLSALNTHLHGDPNLEMDRVNSITIV